MLDPKNLKEGDIIVRKNNIISSYIHNDPFATIIKGKIVPDKDGVMRGVKIIKHLRPHRNGSTLYLSEAFKYYKLENEETYEIF
jgi:hypothetical protein